MGSFRRDWCSASAGQLGIRLKIRSVSDGAVGGQADVAQPSLLSESQALRDCRAAQIQRVAANLQALRAKRPEEEIGDELDGFAHIAMPFG